MPKYLVMLRCSRARSNANRHRQETPAYLPYRIEAPKALEAAEIRRLAVIALWWLCVGIVLSNLLSVLLQNLTEWIMSLV